MTDDKNLQFNSQQIRGLLSPYLDNEVTAEERQLVEQGLAASAELRQELEALRHTVGLLAALPPVPAPRPFTLTEAQVRPAAPTARKSLFRLPWWVQGWAALAATLLCVLVAGGIFWRTQLGQYSAVMPAAEIANAPQITAPAPEKEAANAVIPTESPLQEAAAAPAEGGVEELAAAREAAAGPTDELQAEIAASPPVASPPQEASAAQVEALAQEEVDSAAVTAMPTGDVMTLAESQPVSPPAADQEAATQSLAALAPEPTHLPMATVPSAAPAMKEAAGAGQSSGAVEAATPAEIPPTAEVQSYAAPAQESAPIVPATEAMEDQVQALPPTATIAPPTSTPTALASPTTVARLTLSAPTPQVDTPVPTAARPENNTGIISLVSLAVVIILLVIWLNRSRLFR